jgi:glycosyltransferase involved in cell wall biosynthesis
MHKRLCFLTVVPSPYQRDVFAAIAARSNVPLSVHYLERAAPDSPWPNKALESWENLLDGFTFGRGSWRSHVNWGLPRTRPDEIWVVNGAMTDVTTQFWIRRLGRRTPWVFWGESPSQTQGISRRWLQKIQYRPLRHARAIVGVGERARFAYSQLAPGAPTFNQPYTCRLSAFASAAAGRRSNSLPTFLYCGQMIIRKGIDILLEAFGRILAENVQARLQLVGREGALPELLATLPAEARARVHYAGFKAPEELPTIFGEADVFILPSRRDGWGVVVNQALGAGLPVICSDAVGAGYDLITPGVNGEIVPAGNVEALAEAMTKLARSPELRAQYGKAALVTAEKLTPERAAEFWENLVEKIAHNE